MVMNVNTNVGSIVAQRALTKTSSGLATSMQRLSTGLRINSAKDDSAGLAIATRMDSQIRGISQGLRNANDGISLAQVAEGALGSITDALQRMRELALQAANGSNGTTDRASLSAEYVALRTEVAAIATRTNFNGQTIIGANAGAKTFQIGPNQGNTITVTTSSYATAAQPSTATITTSALASAAIGTIDTVLTNINTSRAALGAVQSRIEFAMSSLDSTRENTAAARGRIMDTDFAAETASLTRLQILQQAGTAMLSQANNAPQQVLSLLQ